MSIKSQGSQIDVQAINGLQKQLVIGFYAYDPVLNPGVGDQRIFNLATK